MENFNGQVSIQNFKSIKNIKFQTKRVNVLIGEPNTGKTNILEALSLFALQFTQNAELKLKEFIRIENMYHLFYEQDTENKIDVSFKNLHIETFTDNNHLFDINYTEHSSTKNDLTPIVLKFDSNGDFKSRKPNFLGSPIRITSLKIFPYTFQSASINQSFPQDKNLHPPYGNNLTDVILKSKELRKIIAPIFKEYGFELLLRQAERTIELQKRKDGIMIGYPYSTISDTLQRIIFYNTVIYSNKDSVILLNEPLTHVFPFYSTDFAEKIATDKSNQYFITTHNPYIIQKLMEKTPIEELNILVTYYEDDQTKVKIATEQQLSEFMNFGMHILSNLETILEDE